MKCNTCIDVAWIKIDDEHSWLVQEKCCYRTKVTVVLNRHGMVGSSFQLSGDELEKDTIILDVFVKKKYVANLQKTNLFSFSMSMNQIRLYFHSSTWNTLIKQRWNSIYCQREIDICQNVIRYISILHNECNRDELKNEKRRKCERTQIYTTSTVCVSSNL